jgi:MoaA/NifB/PqqE/SkfB family radical SAM enzyme
MAVPEMSGEQAKDVISQIARLGVPHMIFAGGEPLLREDLPELIAHAHQLGIVTRMSTNGLLLTRERVRELKRAGLDVCGVSLDSPDAEVHDRLRGVPGTFDRAVRGLRYLREEGVFTKLLGCASRENVSSGGVERLIELGRELRVSTIYLLLPIMAGRWADAQHEVLTGSEMDYVRGLHDFTRIHMELAAPDNICCLSSKGVLCVRAGGDVTACPYVPFGMGNVNAEPLAAIWARHAAALEVVTPGHCPLNVPAAREELRLHSEAVRAGGPGGAPDR